MPMYPIYSTPAPFNASDLPKVNFAQVADTVYYAHTSYPPGKLVRLGHTNWVWSTVTFSPTVQPPTGIAGVVTNPNTDSANSGNAYFPEPASYVVTAFNEARGQESRPSSAVTLTNCLSLKRNYNTITWAAPSTGPAPDYYRVYKADQTGFYGYIGSTTQLSFVDDNISGDLSSGPPTGYNPFPGTGDYPGTVKFHEQRSWWGNTNNHPNSIYASRSADYENMDYATPGQENDSLAIGLVGDKVNVVNQLASTKQGLLALTTNAIFSIQGSNQNYITATPPPKATVEITRGVSALRPIQVDSALLYQTVRTGEVRALGYEFSIDGLKTDDVSIFSRHLFDNHSIVDWCWVEKPHSSILAVRDDGVMLCFTWDQAQQVWGWTTWTTNGSYLRVTAITEQGEDRIYTIVQRPFGTYIERFSSELWADVADACYLDCAKTYLLGGANATTFMRLDHLEGQTVYAWVDGALYTKDAKGNPLVVTNGQVTLPTGGAKVTIGLPFTAEIETLPLAMQTKAGWSVARPQDNAHAVIRVINTRNFTAGPNRNNLFEPKLRTNEPMGTLTGLFTGNVHIDLAAASGDEATVVLRSDVPAPFHVAGVMVEPSFGDLS